MLWIKFCSYLKTCISSTKLKWLCACLIGKFIWLILLFLSPPIQLVLPFSDHLHSLSVSFFHWPLDTFQRAKFRRESKSSRRDMEEKGYKFKNVRNWGSIQFKKKKLRQHVIKILFTVSSKPQVDCNCEVLCKLNITSRSYHWTDSCFEVQSITVPFQQIESIFMKSKLCNNNSEVNFQQNAIHLRLFVKLDLHVLLNNNFFIMFQLQLV